jgi:hypothetical protein
MNDDMSRALALRQALQGAVYPLSREQLAWLARENGAPSAVLTLLSVLPRGDFRSLEAVESRLGEQLGPTAST